MKRRKIAAQLASNANSALDIYQGYPEWRRTGYEPQLQILTQIFARLGSNFGEFKQIQNIAEKVNIVTNMLNLVSNQIEQLALLTLIRQELSKSDITPDLDAIFNKTNLVDCVF